MRARIEEIDDKTEAHIYTANLDDLRLVADDCKARQNAGLTGNGDMKHVASVPGFFVQQYINQNKITFREFMRPGSPHPDRMLSDPALAHFRIWKGKL